MINKINQNDQIVFIYECFNCFNCFKFLNIFEMYKIKINLIRSFKDHIFASFFQPSFSVTIFVQKKKML